jgi:hypothetical protein
LDFGKVFGASGNQPQLALKQRDRIRCIDSAADDAGKRQAAERNAKAAKCSAKAIDTARVALRAEQDFDDISQDSLCLHYFLAAATASWVIKSNISTVTAGCSIRLKPSGQQSRVGPTIPGV